MEELELKGRILAMARSQPSPDRPTLRRQARWVMSLAAVVVLVVFLSFGGFRAWGAPRPPALIALTTGGTLAIAVWTFALLRRRAQALVGPDSRTLATTVVLVPLASFTWKVSWSLLFAGSSVWWADRPGLRCFGLSMLLSLLVFAAVLVLGRRTDPVHPASRGAALGVASGAAGATLMDLWCPVGHPVHVLLGHILPLLLLALLGASLGRFILDLPADDEA